MTVPVAVTQQWINEVKSISAAMYALSQRCRQVAAKTSANGIYSEDAPPGSDVDMDAIRNAYNNMVLPMIAMFDNAAVGITDRTTINWVINQDVGL